VTLRAISLDLDDTLWPVWPAIRRAEAGLHAWLAVHAPATATTQGAAGLRAHREAIVRDRPDLTHDLSALRRESIRRALAASGDDPGLAEPAFEVFFDLRQQVDLYDDARPALARLARHYRLVALSNGNADVHRVPGLGGLFHAALSAQGLGWRKPQPEAFAAACAAVACAPCEVLHVGDDGPADVDGALAAGLQAAWLRRADLPAPPAPQAEPQHVVADLAELADRLGV